MNTTSEQDFDTFDDPLAKRQELEQQAQEGRQGATQQGQRDEHGNFTII